MSVFTPVSHRELRQFLKRYPVGPVIGFQGIGEGVENSNFFVDTEDGRWVLTLFERLNYDDLPFFLGLMDHMACKGLPCAAPLRTHDGQTLVELNGKPAAIVQRLKGGSELFVGPRQCAQAGRLLAQMHAAAADFSMQAVNTRGARWRSDIAAELLPQCKPDIAELVTSELAAQQALDLSALPQGIIHADLFRDNVLFSGEQLSGVIDFYYACNDALIYDLAIAVNDWCFDTHGDADPERVHAMTEAYLSERAVSADEREAWPLVLRAAALRFYLSRLQDWMQPREGGMVHVKDPDAYRRILQRHRAAPMSLPT